MSVIMLLLAVVLVLGFIPNHCRRVHLTRDHLQSAKHENKKRDAAFARLLQSFKPVAGWHSTGYQVPAIRRQSRGHVSMHESTQTQGLAFSADLTLRHIRELVSTVEIAQKQGLDNLFSGLKIPKKRKVTEKEEKEFIREIETNHEYDLMMIATHEGKEAGMSWETKELTDVHVKHADEEGMIVEEGICDPEEGSCKAIDVPIRWPKGMSISELPDMRKAFTALSRKAYFAVGGNEDIPSEYVDQQGLVYSIMTLINSEFPIFLKYYVVKHMQDALGDVSDIGDIRMTQLNYEGFTVEIESTNYRSKKSEGSKKKLVQLTWSVSQLFDKPCTSPEEVEQQLMEMFEIPAEDE
mmetsp:Transcript_146505/g.255564  ORF Transcript_146505/g.255564 Transcript_146505/m.255564 type:complete len:352 (+) Transcript_146505:53-1108(+)